MTPSAQSVKVAVVLLETPEYGLQSWKELFVGCDIPETTYAELVRAIATALDEQVERDAKVAEDEGSKWGGDGEDSYGGHTASTNIAAAIRQQVRP